MKCLICQQGETRQGKVTVPLEREGVILIFKDVPAEVCENCGEYYLSEQTTDLLLEQAENAIAQGTQLEVRQFAA
ncbi:MAG: YgiT-type zinc finger protein [Cyanobacteria bacterium]|jgi:YgiT-type zinc finger domain-containing protein|nr:YgiT-type zinc finger protein [Cyanobacteria bacterium GSL.Bin1]